MNKVILIGRLGADPELRQTTSGKSVCNFSIATNEKRGGQDHTEWHKITAWERQAELCNQYLQKGRQVAVEGSIRTRSYQSNDGQTRYSTEIHVHRVEFISDGASGQQRQPQGGQQHTPPAGYPPGYQPQGGQQPQSGYQQPQGHQGYTPQGGQPQPAGGYQQPPQGGYQPQGQSTQDPGFAPPHGQQQARHDDVPF